MEIHDPQSPQHPPVLLDELILEILSWLPVKSLLQFRSVSKSWKSLISSNPYFIRLHMQRSHTNANLILTYNNYSIFQYVDDDAVNEMYCISCSKRSLFTNPSSIIPQDGNGSYCRLEVNQRPIGSCYGLVCLLETHFVNYAFFQHFRFWNPVLRLRSKKSPPLLIDSPYRSSVRVLFRVMAGFGYDSSSNTFKVAAVILGSQDTIVKVHTMGDYCWRNILCFPTFPFLHHQYRGGQFVSGTLNWLAFRKPGLDYEWNNVTVDQLVIFSLDLEKETYKHLLLPTGFDELPPNEPKLGVLKDCLCLYHCHRGTHLVIWQMKEFGVEKSWTQLINVSYQHLQIDIEAYTSPPLPLCTSENGDVILLTNNDDYEAVGSEAVLYNWKDNTVECIEISNNSVWMDAKEFVQSLVLPY